MSVCIVRSLPTYYVVRRGDLLRNGPPQKLSCTDHDRHDEIWALSRQQRPFSEVRDLGGLYEVVGCAPDQAGRGLINLLGLLD